MTKVNISEKSDAGNSGKWLLYYLWNALVPKKITPSRPPSHIMLCIVDHFEPFNGGVDLKNAASRVRSWSDNYPVMASNFLDADGRTARHTWFYPPHHDQRFLKDLVLLCQKGYGEIEMHLHHNRMRPFPDDENSLRAKIIKCIDDYSRYGIFCLPDGNKRFAFIHGDWSLDNACGETVCGVNNEISILRDCGCYADFTFPSLGKAQPDKINSIYYAKDDPAKPKSYNWGQEVGVSKKPNGDLLIISGIIGLRRDHGFKFSIEASNIDGIDYPSLRRIDYWIRHAPRVNGKSNWLFIKLHTHGAREENWDSLFGGKAKNMHRYLAADYNDGENYCLHYVTAREMYNIIKAAEAGKDGNPGNYRDFLIPEYQYKL